MLIANPSEKPKVNSYTVTLGPNLKVTKDMKSKARVINFPFDFPSEDKGVIILCRLHDNDWTPFKDIKSITIEFV